MPRTWLDAFRDLFTVLLKNFSFARCEGQKALRASLLALAPGGAREARTPDLLRAKQALSQLSYGTVSGGSGWS